MEFWGSKRGSPYASKRVVLNDRFLLGEELGRGACGQVYKAVDYKTGQSVAIKQISLTGVSFGNLTSVMGEIDLLKELNHKNIVNYVGSFKTATHLYIVLEYMENGSLAKIIKPNKFGIFPESLVAVYIAQVLRGLKYLHDRGVVHRDIKGANILINKNGLVKLADFGVASKLVDLEDENGNQLAINKHVVGSPYWMAPEIIEMTDDVTPSCDIWSLGCLVIEILLGTPPYFELQPMSALFRIVQDERPPIPDELRQRVSPQLIDFLEACFQKDRRRRPSAKELINHPWLLANRRTLKMTLEMYKPTAAAAMAAAAPVPKTPFDLLHDLNSAANNAPPSQSAFSALPIGSALYWGDSGGTAGGGFCGKNSAMNGAYGLTANSTSFSQTGTTACSDATGHITTLHPSYPSTLVGQHSLGSGLSAFNSPLKRSPFLATASSIGVDAAAGSAFGASSGHGLAHGSPATASLLLPSYSSPVSYVPNAPSLFTYQYALSERQLRHEREKQEQEQQQQMSRLMDHLFHSLSSTATLASQLGGSSGAGGAGGANGASGADGATHAVRHPWAMAAAHESVQSVVARLLACTEEEDEEEEEEVEGTMAGAAAGSSFPTSGSRLGPPG